MQDPRSRKDWMLDILDQVMPAETPAELLWYGKYGEASAFLAFEIWKRTEGRKFEYFPHFSGQSPDKYAFLAFIRGVGLLLRSEDVEPGFEPALSQIRQAFMKTADRTLTLAELLGYVMWALEYERESVVMLMKGVSADAPYSTRASLDHNAASFLETLLTEEEFKLARAVRRERSY